QPIRSCVATCSSGYRRSGRQETNYRRFKSALSQRDDLFDQLALPQGLAFSVGREVIDGASVRADDGAVVAEVERENARGELFECAAGAATHELPRRGHEGGRLVAARAGLLGHLFGVDEVAPDHHL